MRNRSARAASRCDPTRARAAIAAPAPTRCYDSSRVAARAAAGTCRCPMPRRRATTWPRRWPRRWTLLDALPRDADDDALYFYRLVAVPRGHARARPRATWRARLGIAAGRPMPAARRAAGRRPSCDVAGGSAFGWARRRRLRLRQRAAARTRCALAPSRSTPRRSPGRVPAPSSRPAATTSAAGGAASPAGPGCQQPGAAPRSLRRRRQLAAARFDPGCRSTRRPRAPQRPRGRGLVPLGRPAPADRGRVGVRGADGCPASPGARSGNGPPTPSRPIPASCRTRTATIRALVRQPPRAARRLVRHARAPGASALPQLLRAGAQRHLRGLSQLRADTVPPLGGVIGAIRRNPSESHDSTSVSLVAPLAAAPWLLALGAAAQAQQVLRVTAIPDEAPTELARKVAPLGEVPGAASSA